MKKLGLTLMVFFPMVPTGIAQKGNPDDFKQVIDLEPTIISKRYHAQGRAAIGQKNGVQYFGVQMICNIEDGTIFNVLVTTSEGTFPVGAITIFLEAGQLRLQSSRDPSPAFPITDIETVTIRDMYGMVWLEGSF